MRGFPVLFHSPSASFSRPCIFSNRGSGLGPLWSVVMATLGQFDFRFSIFDFRFSIFDFLVTGGIRIWRRSNSIQGSVPKTRRFETKSTFRFCSRPPCCFPPKVRARVWAPIFACFAFFTVTTVCPINWYSHHRYLNGDFPLCDLDNSSGNPANIGS